MNACPGEDELRRFLDGGLGALGDVWVEVHLEHCAGCRQRLESLRRDLPAGSGEWTLDPGQCRRLKDDLLAGTDAEEGGAAPGATGDWRATDLDGDAGSGRDHGRNVPSTRELEGAADSAAGEEASQAVHEAATMVRDPEATTSRGWDGREPSGSGHPKDPGRWPYVAGYEILQQLGEGGMGVVYSAKHLGLKRPVALKMIRGGGHAGSDAYARFRIEAESVARLRHPNIIQIYDIGEADGLPFVALELLEGGGLDRRLAGNPQPGRAAAALVMTLAAAIQVAHENGIIHRDLKPANVLFATDGVLKVTDFGLAKRVDSDDGHTQSGQIMGSPSYMAPEQARGDSRSVGPAADIYAMGAILYEMLTGRPPFKGATPMETVIQVVDAEPVAPSRLVPRIPRDLETICLKCLHKDPARRYASAQAMADDLKRYLDGRPILGRRTPAWERGAKWARRHPARTMVGVLAILALAGGIAGLFAYKDSRLRRLAKVLDEGSGLERRDAAQSLNALKDVKRDIEGFLPRLGEFKFEPLAEALRTRLERKLDVVDFQVADYNTKEAQKARLDAASQQFREFRERFTRAIFQDAEFTGLDLPGDREATRRAAVAALDVYADPGTGDSWSLRTLPESLLPSERVEVTEGCYELLLVLSQVESKPDSGLRRLDQASRLRPSPSRAYHFRRAACLERAGDRPAADRERQAGEALEPAGAFDHYLAGQELYKRDPAAALDHFNEALRQEPGRFWAQCLSAICWLRLHNPAAALAGLNACLKGEPRFAWLYILRGFASGLVAEHAPPGSKRLAPRAAEADYRLAMEILDEKPNDELRYVVLVNRGFLRARRGDWDGATADLKAAIQLGDHGALASAELADVYLKQGRRDEAIEQFTRAIERRPDWAPLYRGRADVILESPHPGPALCARALADLDRAIRLEEPGNTVVARDETNRSWLLALQGDLTGALAACEAAIGRVGDYEPAHRLRLDLLRRLKRHDDVIRSCDPLIAAGKASAAIYDRRALAREAIRDYSGAIEDVTTLMARGGDRPALLRRRGWLYIVADSPRLALQDFREAIRLDPSDGDGYNGLGLARLRLGQHIEAVADADRAIALGEPSTDLYYRAARVYALAAVVVAAKARKNGQENARLVGRYQDHAAELLRDAIRRYPADGRAEFVRDVVLADPDLRTIRRRVLSMDFAGPVAAPAPARAVRSR